MGELARESYLRRAENRLYDVLGTDWCGGTGPPMSHLSLDLPREEHDAELVAMILNDGFELWLGYPHEWCFHMNRRQARALAFWYLGLWVREWFGLRRWLWYRLLHRRVERYQQAGAR